MDIFDYSNFKQYFIVLTIYDNLLIRNPKLTIPAVAWQPYNYRIIW